MIYKKLSKKFLARTLKSSAKFWDLLFFVVATKFFYRFFLYHNVSAHLKNFARARAATPLKNCLNVKQKA